MRGLRAGLASVAPRPREIGARVRRVEREEVPREELLGVHGTPDS